MTVPSPRRLPLLTLVLVGVALVLLAAPQAAASLRYERALLLAEPWRFLLGHLVHERSIAAVDLVVLAGLGAWWERRSRATCAWILLASGLAASFALAFTSYGSYSGSSALGSGLFVAAALDLARGGRGRWRVAGAVLLLAFLVKCALEAAGAEALIAALPSGTHVAVAAHAAGGAGGAMVVFARVHRERAGEP